MTVHSATIRTLSNNDSDSYENVPWKVNSRCLRLYRAYSISFNLSNVDKFFWSWILEDCIEVQEKKKESRLVFTSSTKREIRHFHVVIVQWRREMYKKAWCTCKIVVLLIQTFFRCRYRCLRRSRCLSSPICRPTRSFTRLENKQGIEHTSLVHQESISPSTLFFSAHFLT